MKDYRLQKYKWWELFFYRYRFIRRLSKGYWVKLLEDGYDWVKMDKAQFEAMTFKSNIKFQIEDWTSPTTRRFLWKS